MGVSREANATAAKREPKCSRALTLPHGPTIPDSCAAAIRSGIPPSDTAMLAESISKNGPEYRKVLESTAAGGVISQPEEIAEAAVWLCSDHARRVNGQGLVVDGGGVLR